MTIDRICLSAEAIGLPGKVYISTIFLCHARGIGIALQSGTRETQMRTALLSATVLLLVTNAYAQSLNEQPAIPHAHYGRDGFWHCDPGYAAGESGGCEPVVNPARFSASGRLREFEIAERMEATARMQAQ
jgi:hypothetical protein